MSANNHDESLGSSSEGEWELLSEVDRSSNPDQSICTYHQSTEELTASETSSEEPVPESEEFINVVDIEESEGADENACVQEAEETINAVNSILDIESNQVEHNYAARPMAVVAGQGVKQEEEENEEHDYGDSESVYMDSVELQEAREENVWLSDQLAALQLRSEDVERQLESMEKILAETLTEKELLVVELMKSQAQNAKSVDQILAETLTEKDLLVVELTQSQEQNVKNYNTIMELSKRFQAEEAEKRQLADEVEKLKKYNIDRLHEQSQQLTSSSQSMMDKLTSALFESRNNLQIKEAELATAKSQIDDLAQINAELYHKEEMYQTDVQLHVRQIADQKSMIAILNEELRKAQTQREGFERQLHQMQDENISLTDCLLEAKLGEDNLSMILNEVGLDEQRNAQNANGSPVVDEWFNLRATIEHESVQLKASNEALTKDNDDLRIQIAKAEEEITSLKQKVEKVVQKNRDMSDHFQFALAKSNEFGRDKADKVRELTNELQLQNERLSKLAVEKPEIEGMPWMTEKASALVQQLDQFSENINVMCKTAYGQKDAMLHATTREEMLIWEKKANNLIAVWMSAVDGVSTYINTVSSNMEQSLKENLTATSQE